MDTRANFYVPVFPTSRTRIKNFLGSIMKRLLDENLYISLKEILCRTSLEGRSQIVVPSVLIPEVLRLAHDEHLSGHQGEF